MEAPARDLRDSPNAWLLTIGVFNPTHGCSLTASEPLEQLRQVVKNRMFVPQGSRFRRGTVSFLHRPSGVNWRRGMDRSLDDSYIAATLPHHPLAVQLDRGIQVFKAAITVC